MIRIALVGEIGSGKTFVSKCFNYPVFNADEEVKRIYKNNRKCFRKLKEKFPKNIKKFPIQKSELKKIINKKNIKILSRVIHPYVRDGLNKFLTKNRKKKYVILDIPLCSVGPTAMLSILKPRLEKTVEIRVKTPGSLYTVIDNVFFIKFNLKKNVLKFKKL